jgi:hypothetical protein
VAYFAQAIARFLFVGRGWWALGTAFPFMDIFLICAFCLHFMRRSCFLVLLRWGNGVVLRQDIEWGRRGPVEAGRRDNDGFWARLPILLLFLVLRQHLLFFVIIYLLIACDLHT